jgi:hypothetical protein
MLERELKSEGADQILKADPASRKANEEMIRSNYCLAEEKETKR